MESMKTGCKAKLFSVFYSILFIYTGCTSTNRLTQGEVKPIDFYSIVKFTTAKSIVLIPCELNGELKNFIFDTGAQVTTIQRDSIFGDIITVRGGSNRTIESGSETVKLLRIGEVDFINTFATNGNESFLNEQIPNYGGTLGRSIIDKSNWLIDYPNQTITLSNQQLSDESFTDIPLVQSSNTPFTTVEIDGKDYRAIIDLGSTSIFNVPQDTELAKELLAKYQFVENKRERYTVGGNQTITELVGTVPLLTIGETTFEKIKVNINQSSQIRLGMPFFKDYVIFIDNSDHRFKIKLEK